MGDRKMRVLIVDDEPLARKLIREMLKAHPDVEVAGEAANAETALHVYQTEPVDLMFLDVEMPEENGLELMAAILARSSVPESSPAAIFVTAFAQYAVSAFDLHAVDYLLKPFDQERFSRALQRARNRLARPERTDETRRILALLEEMHQRERYSERLAIKVGERTYLQPVESIDWIEANGKFVNVHVGKQVYTMRESMAQVAEGLDPSQFVRISRSAIVNLEKIREIQPWFRGDYVVVLETGADIHSTRSFRENLTRLLGR